MEIITIAFVALIISSYAHINGRWAGEVLQDLDQVQARG